MPACERQRLANRAAAFALLAALLAIMGIVAVKTTFDHSRSAAVRAASAAPLAAAFGAALWARSARAQLRRTESESAADAEPEVTGPVDPRVFEEERRASTDLRAIDEVVRAFHRARSVTDGRAETGAVTGVAARNGRVDLPDAGGRRYTERSRTVHVIGDFAVVISAYELERPEGSTRGVAFLQLRLAPEGWRVHDAVSRSVDRAVTERIADPWALAAGGGARRPPNRDDVRVAARPSCGAASAGSGNETHSSRYDAKEEGSP